MLHCRDDLAETLRAVHRIACIRRRLRRSLFRLCGRHADWKRPPDALQLRARCYLRAPASAVSDWASNSAPPSTLHVAMQRTLTRVVQIFSVALFLYIISTTVHSHINCPLCPRPPLQYPPSPLTPQVLLPAPARAPCPTVWRGQARTPSPRGETLASLRSTQSQQLSRSNASRSPPSCSPSTSSYSPPVRVRYTASSVLLGSSFTKHFGSVQAAHLVQHV